MGAGSVMRDAAGGVKGSGQGLAPQHGRLAAAPHDRHCWKHGLDRRPESKMTQTQNRFFDEIARLMNDAAGVASGVRREFETVFRTQAERIVHELDLVQREDFEAVKEMARLAREESEALKARVAALEAKLATAARPPARQPPSPPPQEPQGGPTAPTV
jgi:BMFP domain-containing protein YqiC